MYPYTLTLGDGGLKYLAVKYADSYTPGPSSSKNRQLNELVKRSARLVFYNFITKYTDIFVEKIQKLLTFLSTKILAYFRYKYLKF